jgi:HEAT repeat protein
VSFRIPYLSRRRSWLFLHVVHRDVYALARAKDVDGLLRLLASESDPEEIDRLSKRGVIAAVLGDLRASDATDSLAQLLHPTESVFVRVNAAVSLSRIGGPDAALALRPALDDERFGVRRAAIDGVSLDDPESLAAMAALAKTDRQRLIRGAAIDALSLTGQDDCVPLFQAKAADHDRIPAIAAIGALIRLNTTASHEALRHLKATSGLRTRLYAARARARPFIELRVMRQEWRKHGTRPRRRSEIEVNGRSRASALG